MEKHYCIFCMNPSEGNICPHCSKAADTYIASPHHLQPGTMLNNRYIIGRVIGEGGFGITYIGLDTFLDLRVAIKEFFPSGIVNRNNTASTHLTANVGGGDALFEKGKERFLSEARTLAKFATDEHVVTVRDFFPCNSTAYIVMDYLEGTDLNKYIAANGKQSFESVVKLLAPIFDVLENVHKAGLIHRDISPSNIMILKSGKIVLLDFGAARDYGSDEKSLSVMLKPGYAPSEQYGSKCQGPWTDVYAIAATMYKMITGIVPEDSMSRVFGDTLKPIKELEPAVTHFESAVVMRGLALDYHERYQSMSVFKEALGAAVRNRNNVRTIPQYKEKPTPLQSIEAIPVVPPQTIPVIPTEKRKKNIKHIVFAVFFFIFSLGVLSNIINALQDLGNYYGSSRTKILPSIVATVIAVVFGILYVNTATPQKKKLSTVIFLICTGISVACLIALMITFAATV